MKCITVHFAISRSAQMCPHVNDVVLIDYSCAPSVHWKVGQLVHLTTDWDGHTWNGDLRLPNGHTITPPLKLSYCWLLKTLLVRKRTHHMLPLWSLGLHNAPLGFWQNFPTNALLLSFSPIGEICAWLVIFLFLFFFFLLDVRLLLSFIFFQKFGILRQVTNYSQKSTHRWPDFLPEQFSLHYHQQTDFWVFSCGLSREHLNVLEAMYIYVLELMLRKEKLIVTNLTVFQHSQSTHAPQAWKSHTWYAFTKNRTNISIDLTPHTYIWLVGFGPSLLFPCMPLMIMERKLFRQKMRSSVCAFLAVICYLSQYPKFLKKYKW